MERRRKEILGAATAEVILRPRRRRLRRFAALALVVFGGYLATHVMDQDSLDHRDAGNTRLGDVHGTEAGGRSGPDETRPSAGITAGTDRDSIASIPALDAPSRDAGSSASHSSIRILVGAPRTGSIAILTASRDAGERGDRNPSASRAESRQHSRSVRTIGPGERTPMDTVRVIGEAQLSELLADAGEPRGVVRVGERWILERELPALLASIDGPPTP
jgi:hypothetical protein